MRNFYSTDSLYILIDFYMMMIKYTLFIPTYSGSVIYKSQLYYIRSAPVLHSMLEFNDTMMSLLIIIIIIINS